MKSAKTVFLAWKCWIYSSWKSCTSPVGPPLPRVTCCTCINDVPKLHHCTARYSFLAQSLPLTAKYTISASCVSRSSSHLFTIYNFTLFWKWSQSFRCNGLYPNRVGSHILTANLAFSWQYTCVPPITVVYTPTRHLQQPVPHHVPWVWASAKSVLSIHSQHMIISLQYIISHHSFYFKYHSFKSYSIHKR